MPFLRPTLLFFLFPFSFFLSAASPAYGAGEASLSLIPSSGAYLVGSTFEVTVALDTHGEQVNTIELHLTFPPDILQIIKPASGVSFIQSWFFPPAFSNESGALNLAGGISTGGINTSNGLITTVTFRAVAPGDAFLVILKTSKVLAHDGRGTDILGSRGGANFTIRVRPPEGPEATSQTHPDPNRWYQNNAPIFSWQRIENAEGYSYSFNENPEELPSATVNTTDLVKTFKDVKDGISYFHLRVFKDGAWSGATHVAARIDTTPPLAFTPRVEYAPQLGAPPLVFFETKDTHAGVDHYAVKVIRTDETTGVEEDVTPFFVETESPYKVPVSFPGKYTVVVRVFDKAGNTRDATVGIVTPTVALLSDQGIRFKNYFIPFKFIYAFFGFLLMVLFLWGLYLLRNVRLIRTRMRSDIASLSQEMQKEYLRFGEHFTHEVGQQIAPRDAGAPQISVEPPAVSMQEAQIIEPDVPEPPGPVSPEM